MAALVISAIAGMLIWLLSLAWLPRLMHPAWVRATEQNEGLKARQQGDA